ncbi:MAG: hypothetical protein OQJ84_01595 [Xanthomonadales bacterium]|nr:hypothetical protein [Xanthomonadales bacterium]
MPDKKTTSVPFESVDTAEQNLWTALGDLPRDEPSPDMRRSFYQRLEQASSRRWSERLRDWLGMRNNAGWITASACVLIGFGVAQLTNQPQPGDQDRLAALEQNINLLNRELILDRLQDEAPGTRLAGVYDARNVVADDAQIAQALLQRAATDRSSSVRSAAIGALGSQLNSDTVGGELMSLLENADSPIVQLALADLVLRNGNAMQLAQLQRLADEKRLNPDIARHVNKSLGSESI